MEFLPWFFKKKSRKNFYTIMKDTRIIYWMLNLEICIFKKKKTPQNNNNTKTYKTVLIIHFFVIYSSLQDLIQFNWIVTYSQPTSVLQYLYRMSCTKWYLTKKFRIARFNKYVFYFEFSCCKIKYSVFTHWCCIFLFFTK